jgi:carbohydrate-selective porin OprB
LGREFFAFSRTTQTFNEQDFSVVELWWTQEFLRDTLEVTVGKLNPRAFYDTNRLRNQNVSFLNQVQAGNLAIGLPGRGIGANLTYRPTRAWYVTGGVHDANGNSTTGDFRDIDELQFAYVTEIGLTPEVENLGRGNYRLTMWYSDASMVRGTSDGAGVALSVDQDLGDSVIGFARYAFADGDAHGARQTLSSGVALTEPFQRANDELGFMLGWSEPKVDAPNDEFIAEVYYRLQLTHTQQLSVGWQGYLTPAFDPDDDFANVLSLRWRLRF